MTVLVGLYDALPGETSSSGEGESGWDMFESLEGLYRDEV